MPWGCRLLAASVCMCAYVLARLLGFGAYICSYADAVGLHSAVGVTASVSV
jgi:hypothetical protein